MVVVFVSLATPPAAADRRDWRMATVGSLAGEGTFFLAGDFLLPDDGLPLERDLDLDRDEDRDLDGLFVVFLAGVYNFCLERMCH